jgi:hypothetical protein
LKNLTVPVAIVASFGKRSLRLCPTQTIRVGLISGFLRVLGEGPNWDRNGKAG